MSDEFPQSPPTAAEAGWSVGNAPSAPSVAIGRLATSGAEPSPAVHAPAAPAPGSTRSARAVVPSEGCGCAACQAKAAAAGGLVFALGQVGYDLVSEARRDSIAQHMGGPAANPWDPSQMLAYLKDNPWEAASIIWTLNADQTPLYAIAPAGPFAARAYELLREFLDEQVRGEIELVSIPGRLGGQVAAVQRPGRAGGDPRAAGHV